MYDLKALYEAESVAHAIQLLQEHPEAQIMLYSFYRNIRKHRSLPAEVTFLYRCVKDAAQEKNL